MLSLAAASLAFSVQPNAEPAADTCPAYPVPYTSEDMLLKHGVIDSIRAEKCPTNGNNKNVM